MTYETIDLDRRHGVGILTLNRPEARNAIDDRMAWEWGEAVSELDADLDVGAIVITGVGSAFCAGADFRRFERAIDTVDARARGEAREGPAHETASDAGVSRPRRDWIAQVRSSKPIVAAINGPCIGAGMTRILPCDVRIASTAATFSMRFVKVGIVPEIGSTQILAQLVGLQAAADLMLSGRTVPAVEALSLGLVLAVVRPEELLDEAISLASSYAENPPGALVEIKRLLYANCVEQDIGLVARREVEVMERSWGSAENREAVAAFREKRAPDFAKLRGR